VLEVPIDESLIQSFKDHRLDAYISKVAAQVHPSSSDELLMFDKS
jgi:hypothetical protein